MRETPWRPVVIVTEVIFVVVLFTLITIYSFRPNWDIDIYWHIKTGEWIVEHLRIPNRDIFSAVDTERPWTPFQWLYEVLVYEVETRLGFVFIRAIHAALFLSAFAGFYWVFRTLGPGRLVAALLILLTLVLSEDRFRIRPDAFNFFFLTLVLPDLFAKTLRARGLFRMGLVAALWANIHAGGAILLPLSSLAILLGRALGVVSWATLKQDVLRLGTTLLPMLPMPAFLPGLKTAFSMYQESAILIPEWHPPVAYFVRELSGRFTAHHAICGVLPYLILFVLGGLTVGVVLKFGFRGAMRRLDAGLLALAWFYALLSAHSARFVFMGGIVVFLQVLLFREWVEKVLDSMAMKLAIVFAGGVLLGISYEYSVILQRGGLTQALRLLQHDHEPGHFPEKASDAIAGMGLRGRIFHFTKWGGYLLYRHFPDCTVFTDGRGNFTAEEREDLVRTHRPFEREDALEEAWNKYRFDIVIFPPPVFPLLTWDREKWMLIYRDDVAEVFLRRGEANKENERKVLDYFAARGILTKGGVNEFQEEYLRVLGTEYLEQEEVQKRASSAIRRMVSKDLVTRASGYYDMGLIWFAASRYERAAEMMAQVLDMGFRHSTATLYLGWSKYIAGDLDGARKAIMQLIEPPAQEAMQKDWGPLRWAGQQILNLLVRRLGLAKRV